MAKSELVIPPPGAGPEPDEEETLEGSRMTLGEHLEELRSRLIRSTAAVFVAFALCWAFHGRLAELALWPGDRAIGWTNADLAAAAEQRLAADPELKRTELFLSDDEASPLYHELRAPVTNYTGFSAGSGFMFYLRVTLYAAFVLSGTYVLWQMWQFVAAGLYSREKRVVYRFFPLSVGLFFGGIVFGYFVMVPYAQYFLARMSIDRISWQPKIEEYWMFLKNLCLALGVVFQLPVVMLVLARVELVDPKKYRRYRGHFLLSALVLAAVLTPPDPVTQMMMALPMVVLYELGILLAGAAQKKAQVA